MSRKENDDFIATKAEKTFDDEGKTVDANVSSNYRGGLLYKGKVKDYPGIKEILKKKKAKVIKIDIGKNKKD